MQLSFLLVRLKYDKKIQDIAVKAVQSLGYEFGGVDILFDKKTGEPHLAEANFPFNTDSLTDDYHQTKPLIIQRQILQEMGTCL